MQQEVEGRAGAADIAQFHREDQRVAFGRGHVAGADRLDGRYLVVVDDGSGRGNRRPLSRGLSAQCEAFAPFIYVIVSSLDGDAERGGVGWHIHTEATIVIDRHRLGASILVGDGHFSTGEVRARRRAVARQCQSDGGRCCARVAQADVKRGAVAFRDGWAADARYYWAVVCAAVAAIISDGRVTCNCTICARTT